MAGFSCASVKVSQLREILDRRGLHLRRELGQNFLIDEHQADRLAELSGVAEQDHVIEVGTGLGCLTRALARRVRRVVSIEVDSGLIRALQAESCLPDNVELVHADILKLDLQHLIDDLGDSGAISVRFVANLPYSVATPLMRQLLDHRVALADWSVMLQKEVARRLFADVGTRDYGSLAVLHHLTCTPLASSTLGANCFFPVPKVDSVFTRLSARVDCPLTEATELRRLERVVRACFGNRRKTIANSLRAGGFARESALVALGEAGIDPGTRAETVEPERLLGLTRAFDSMDENHGTP